jgi:TPR repeat protein
MLTAGCSKQSYSDALKWLRRAAEQGDALAMANLGSLYGKGFRNRSAGFRDRVAFANMSVDRVEAYKWFNLALQHGHTGATRDLWLLKRMMSAYQNKLAEGKIEEYIRERRDVRELPD